jgi:hypothetical protein
VRQDSHSGVEQLRSNGSVSQQQAQAAYVEATLSYETRLNTLRAYSRSMALEVADATYMKLYMADQLRRRAEKYMGGTK